MVHVSLGLNNEIKLNETLNAWKPSVLKLSMSPSIAITDDVKEEEKKEKLLKKFRGILNKLTPENFDILLEQIKELDINTKDKLDGIILILIEKAIDEPNFSIAYAKLCKNLSTVSNENGKINQTQFRTALITKCQLEFQSHVININLNDSNILKLKTNNTTNCCTDTIDIDTDKNNQHKEHLMQQLKENEQKLRRRSVCTVRFIGELYKIDMLTTNIMISCITVLLDNHSEEKLECLCKLLTTIGEKIETKCDKSNDKNLIEYFEKIQFIVEKKSPKQKISSRVR